jgi:hypothetical protein
MSMGQPSKGLTLKIEKWPLLSEITPSSEECGMSNAFKSNLVLRTAKQTYIHSI